MRSKNYPSPERIPFPWEYTYQTTVTHVKCTCGKRISNNTAFNRLDIEITEANDVFGITAQGPCSDCSRIFSFTFFTEEYRENDVHGEFCIKFEEPTRDMLTTPTNIYHDSFIVVEFWYEIDA